MSEPEEEIESEEEFESVEEVTPSVSVKCRPKKLVELIENLNDAQRAAVRRIGFGGILELKFKSYPLAHVPLFLEAFSDESYVFRASELKEFMVTKHDVYDCFMLPRGPRTIELVPTGPQKGSQDPDNKRLKDRWRKAYNGKRGFDGVNLGLVFKDIEKEKYKAGGEQFCRLFVLLTMSSFLTPTSNSVIDFKLLKAIKDVNLISQYDWCSYVLECMVKAAADVVKRKKILVGCIPFLLITYFHRFDFRGKSYPHELPLIKHWDRAKLSERLHGELDNGPLGRQTWSLVKYPRCLEEEALTIGGVDTEKQVLTIGDVVTDAAKQLCATSHKKKFIEIELPVGVEDDEELKNRAVDDVHEVFLKLQRNAMVFYSWYSNVALTLKGLTSGASSSSGLVPTQSTQEFFQSQKMKEYVGELKEIAERIKDSIEFAPVLQDAGLGNACTEDEEEEVDGDGEDEEEKVDGDAEDGEDEEEEVDGDVEDGEDKEGEVDGNAEVSDEDFEDGVAVSLGIDEVVSAKACEVPLEQIMEAVHFYSSSEFNEAVDVGTGEEEVSRGGVGVELRAAGNKLSGKDVQELLEFARSREINEVYKRRKVRQKLVNVVEQVREESDLSDCEILQQYYSNEEIEKPFRKAAEYAAAQKEQEHLALEGLPSGGEVESGEKEPGEVKCTESASPGTQFLFTTTELS